METKHTKGEWTIQVNETLEQEVFVKTKKAGIARLFENSAVKTKEEAIANAKLIAAAPDLLDSLIHIVKSVEKVNFVTGIEIDNAKQAIKKATE